MGKHAKTRLILVLESFIDTESNFLYLDVLSYVRQLSNNKITMKS